MPNNPKLTMERLKKLVKQLKAIDTYRQISFVLSWDQETMMPEGAINARSNQLTTLTGHLHDMWAQPNLTTEIKSHIDIKTGQPNPNLTNEEQTFIRELYPIWKRNTQLSKELVTKLSEVTSQAQHVWQEARKTNNFELFAPHLQTIIDLQKEKVTQLGYQDHPDNTVLDEYEHGMTVEKIDAKFNPLKEQTLHRIKNEVTTEPK